MNLQRIPTTKFNQESSRTIIFDHDIIDGAPAARFTRRLVELIESGSGLDETDGW